MSTCMEYIRKKNNQNKEVFNRLENYFKALQDDTVEDYHDKHNRKEEKTD